jgi:hypothetical protein
VQQWEYLEVARQRSPLARDTAGQERGSIFMIDSLGRRWQRNPVEVPAGVTGGMYGEQYHYMGWMSDARTLTALGEEGWELVGVLGGGTRISLDGGASLEADLLIFRRPKPAAAPGP